ncbi:MAG TPA: hypothetical protein VKX17_00815, partial [Planctomycetota bacterium]|nr:hypothetical protein [Planctomycetota bacterium]
RSQVERKLILRYLRSGVVFAEFLGFPFCRFTCGIPNESMGCREFTDGEWVWPEGLVHYVEAHDVVLPDEFVLTMRQNRFRVPTVKLKESPIDEFASAIPSEPNFSLEFWLNWARRMKSTPSTFSPSPSDTRGE